MATEMNSDTLKLFDLLKADDVAGRHGGGADRLEDAVSVDYALIASNIRWRKQHMEDQAKDQSVLDIPTPGLGRTSALFARLAASFRWKQVQNLS